MTFMTNDYLEYYLTLLGWIINNGIWNMISDTGLFAVPFVAIVMREWLKVRGEGADEGNKGVLSLARIETHIYVGYIVVALAGIPVVNVSFDTIEFDQARAQQCQYNLPAPADTGWSTSFSSLAGKSAQMPLWWAMMHALSKGFTAGAVAAIPCGTDLRQMRMEVDNTRVNNPLLAQEIADFSKDCYGPSRARLFMRQPDLGSVAEDNKALQDLNWIGSRFLLNTPGYYDTDYSKTPRQSWPYNATRDAGLPQVGGGGGYPTCKQWWADSGIGLRDRIKDQVDPDLMTSFLKWAKWLNQDEVSEAVIRQVISPSSQVKGNVYSDYGGQVIAGCLPLGARRLIMNAHTNKGFASRVGFGLGTLVRFCLHDRRPVVRWVKRVSLLVVLFVIFAQNFTWMASAFMTLLSFGLIGWALVKGDFSIFQQLEKDEAQAAPYGRDVFGRELNSWGKVDSQLFDPDSE